MKRTGRGAVDLSTGLRFKRVLLKLSGEVLAGEQHLGLDREAILSYARQVAELAKAGFEVGVVLGGGNFWRGRMAPYMDQVNADSMGMLATIMNGIAFADALRTQDDQAAVLMTSISLPQFAELFVASRAIEHLEDGKVVIFAGGTGNPFFTTDSAAALRGLQIRADVVLKGTMTDGVYDSDPRKNPQAKRFSSITFTEALKRDLKVMDATAFSLCRDHNLPVYVFNVTVPGNLRKVVIEGENLGTLVKEEMQ
ncbi:MAG: UMP kinase [bacterium]|nr:UMP kinase [bacterium]